MDSHQDLQKVDEPFGGLPEMWQAIAAGFLVEKAGRTGSRRTVETYGRTVRRFLAGIDDPRDATPWDVHRFAYALDQEGCAPAPSTVAVRLAAVSAFYDFARRMRAIETNPAADVRRPLARRPQPRGLALEEVTRLLSVIPETPPGLLDRALVITAILTGLRRSELVGLRVSVHGDGVALYEVRTKGGAVRRREMPDPAWKAILSAAAAAGRPIGNDRATVFPVSDATLYAHLRRHAEAAGLADVSPHVLRHTAAKLRRATGATIEDVCSLLGHRSIATTATYLGDLEAERDTGWGQVASALGLAGSASPVNSTPIGTTAGPHQRSRPVQVMRRDGRSTGRPVRWIGGHVHDHLPRRKPTARKKRAGAATDA